MCRVIAELDPITERATGRIVGHEGCCTNGVWFDVHGGTTVFLCIHPNGDFGQPPAISRSFSVAAWQDIVDYIGQQLPRTLGAGDRVRAGG